MKILVRSTNWIGDAVMSIPALRELRRIFPDARITLHTRSWADELFSDASFIDELVTFEKNKWVIKDVLDNSRFLKADDYDLAVILPNSFESAVTSFLSKIPRRIGYNKDLRGLLLTDPIAVPEWKGRKHEVFYYLHLIAEIERRVLGRASAGQNEPDTRLEISADRRSSARAKMKSAGVDPGRPLIAFVAGSANMPHKRWPADDFVALANRLSSELSASVVLIGSKDEVEISRKILASSAGGVTDMTGDTTLGEAAAILSVADAVVSNDTGLAHVSAAVGTPPGVIFGPTDPTATRPYSPNARILRGDTKESWPSVDEVFATAAALLEEDVTDETTGYFS